MIPIHEAMTKARVERGWSRTVLADLSGVSTMSVYNYEAGKAVPGLLNLIALADTLGISLDEYVGRKSV